MSSIDKEIALKYKFATDFEFYAKNCLRIRSKNGLLIKFKLNKAQTHIHRLLEEQGKKKGFVRAIILKGRQQGCSTYVQGRYYWKSSHRFGKRVFILSHLEEATKNLYNMVLRFHENMPHFCKAHTSKSNAKELVFDILDSSYRLATARSEGTGRSDTIQYFHGSEVAFWRNAQDHASGVFQAIPREKGTEIILESTANGLGNYFHEQWQLADNGESDFTPIFVPWYWQPEYQIPIEGEFRITEEETHIRDLYELNNEQILWRRNKIKELSASGADGEKKFCQEYPFTATEAFQTTGEDCFISPSLVMAARKGEAEAVGPLVIGVDPARFGNDRTAIIRRRGRVAFNLQSYSKIDTMEVTGLVHKIIKEENPAKVFVDVGGLGAGVIDRLNEMGYRSIVKSVNSGEKPFDQDHYFNKRIEMWAEMKKWLEESPVSIPNSDTLHADLCAPCYNYDSMTRIRLEKKEDMKKRGIKSPDAGDALALTFAQPVSSREVDISSFINPTISI